MEAERKPRTPPASSASPSSHASTPSSSPSSLSSKSALVCQPKINGLMRGALLSLLCLWLLGPKETQACSCIFSHPQEHYCSADFVPLSVYANGRVALVNVKRNGKGDQRTASYHIKVKREFKMTVKAREALSHGLMFTSGEESACGRKFEPNTRYLITGRVIGEKAWVSICNFVQEWATLSYKQRKGFRRLYALGCHCKVREPPNHSYYSYKHLQYPQQQGHRLAARPGYCHWETKWETRYDCQGLYSLCTPIAPSMPLERKKLGKKMGKHQKQELVQQYECQWVQSQAYRNCMKLRKTDKEKDRDGEREWEP